MMAPVSRSTQTARSEWPPSVAVVIQTCFPQTTGDDQPSPGMGVLNLTFCVSDHVCGRLVESLWPCWRGPRNWGQISPAAEGNAGRIKRIGRRGRIRRTLVGTEVSRGVSRPSVRLRYTVRTTLLHRSREGTAMLYRLALPLMLVALVTSALP